jgi:hypothetical protein
VRRFWQWFSTADGGLEFVEETTTNGCDVLGCYNATAILWQAKSSSTQRFQTTVRAYAGGQAFVFEQLYIDAVANASNGQDAFPVACFPGINITQGQAPLLNYITQHHIFGNVVGGVGLGSYPGDVQGGTPLVLFNASRILASPATANVVVLSPLTGMKVGVQSVASPSMPLTWCAGLNGLTEAIPAGYSYQTLLTFEATIHDALERWGDLLLQHGNKSREEHAFDVTVDALSGWTDNGAFYYYWVRRRAGAGRRSTGMQGCPPKEGCAKTPRRNLMARLPGCRWTTPTRTSRPWWIGSTTTRVPAFLCSRISWTAGGTTSTLSLTGGWRSGSHGPKSSRMASSTSTT